MVRNFLVILFFINGFIGPSAFAQKEETFSSVYQEYNSLIEAENFSGAEPLALKAYELGIEKFGKESSEAATLAYNYGFVLNILREFEDAIPILNQALESKKALLGSKNIELLDIYMELGKANLGTFQTGSAIRYFKKVLNLAAQEFGEQNPVLIDINLEIGNFFVRLFEPGGADFYKNAYSLGKEIFPEGEYRVGVAAFSLGKMYHAQKLRKKAEKLYLEALEIYEKTPPPNIDFLLVAHTFLVQLYSEKGDEEKATKHCVQVGLIRGDQTVDSERPLYKAIPTYPVPELAVEKEGHVVIEYSVGADGKVYDPKVIESDSQGFSMSALETITKWRYAPRIVDGKPVKTDGLRFLIYFNISRD